MGCVGVIYRIAKAYGVDGCMECMHGVGTRTPTRDVVIKELEDTSLPTLPTSTFTFNEFTKATRATTSNSAETKGGF